MQIWSHSHNPLRYTLLHTKFERCSSNGSKLWPCPFPMSKSSAILNLCKFMQIWSPNHNPLCYTIATNQIWMLLLERFKSYGHVRFPGQSRPPSWIYANLCKLGYLAIIPFATLLHIPNVNVVAWTVQKLWTRPFSRSESSAILNLCKFMQISSPTHNPLRYTLLHTKFERCSSNGSKVTAISVFQDQIVRHLEFMQIYAN